MIVIFNNKIVPYEVSRYIIIYPHLDATVIAIKRKAEYYRMAAVLFGYVLQNKCSNESCAF
jgi:hypothetical protein